MPQIHSGGEPFLYRGNRQVGCLLLHGWTSAPQEMDDLGKHLSGHGYTALGLRLPGHATNPGDLNRMRWWDWIAAVDDGARGLGADCPPTSEYWTRR